MALLITATQLQDIFGVKSKSVITDWKNKGLPFVQEGRIFKYDVMEAMLWHQRTINGSPLKNSVNIEEEDEYSVEDKLRLKRIEKLELDMEIQKGLYIPIDEVDITTAGMVTLLISRLRQNMRILPKLLAKKSQVQIKKLLDEEYKNLIEDLENTLTKEVEL